MPEGEGFPDELFVPNYTILSRGNSNSRRSCLLLSLIQMPTQHTSLQTHQRAQFSRCSLLRWGFYWKLGMALCFLAVLPSEACRSFVTYFLILSSFWFVFQPTKSFSICFFLQESYMNGIFWTLAYFWTLHAWMSVTSNNVTKHS